jgi:hypothetical protein
MNINNVNIVIVRYKEKLNWLEHWKPPYPKIYVYNKSFQYRFTDISENVRNLIGDNLQVMNIDNIGREGTTYIYHVLLYYNLTNHLLKKNKTHENKITVFLQGDPFQHLFTDIKPENFQNRLYEELYKHRHTKVAIPLLVRPHRERWDEFPGMNLKLHFYDLFMPRHRGGGGGGEEPAPPEPATTESYEFSPGCQYIVPGNVFYGRTFNFYKHIAICLFRGKNISLYKLFTPDNEYVYSEIDGWSMERLFSFIWNLDYIENPGACASGGEIEIMNIFRAIS